MTIESTLQIKRPPGRPRNPDPIEATKERIDNWANRLEQANAMKAGLMDSDSRHQEIADQRYALIEAIIAEMRS